VIVGLVVGGAVVAVVVSAVVVAVVVSVIVVAAVDDVVTAAAEPVVEGCGSTGLVQEEKTNPRLTSKASKRHVSLYGLMGLMGFLLSRSGCFRGAGLYHNSLAQTRRYCNP